MGSFSKLALAAETLGNTSTLAGPTWALSTTAPGLERCTQMVLDAAGDIVFDAAHGKPAAH